jgi:hypothetical protein
LRCLAYHEVEAGVAGYGRSLAAVGISHPASFE